MKDFLLFCDLRGVLRDDLWRASKLRDQPRRAHALAFVLDFRCPEFWAVITPDDDGKRLLWVRLVQMQ